MALPRYGATTLEAGDLLLRPWRDADADAIASAYQADPEIPRRTGFPFGLTVDQARGYILERRHAWDAGRKAAFGIFDQGDHLLGSISLLEIDWHRREAEIAFWLAREARGRGVATLVVERIASWAADLRLSRLTATVEVTNEGSKRVLERAHFAERGLSPRNRLLHGHWIDEYLYVRELVSLAGSTRESH
jgi:RimJ/RimL family protein N-acetyltransferase